MTLLQDCHLQQGLDTPFWQKWWCHTTPALRGQEALRQVCGIWNIPTITVKSRHSFRVFAWHWPVLIQGLRNTSKQQKLPSASTFAMFEHKEAFSLSPYNHLPLRALSHSLLHGRKGKSMQTSPRLVQWNSEISEQEWSLRVTESSCQTLSVTLALDVAMNFCIIPIKNF